MRLAYAAQKRLWRWFRPRTQGVKVMLFNAAGDILLIRNSYGRSDLFVLPGGGVRPWESPEAAARREVQEELGCSVRVLAPLAVYPATGEGKRDTVHLFEARMEGTPTPDGFEVIDARFFALDALPTATSPATRRRIDEYHGATPRSERW